MFRFKIPVFLRVKHFAKIDEGARGIRDLDADCALPRHRGDDADRLRLHRKGDVVAESGYPVDLHSGRRFKFVSGYHRPPVYLDHFRLYIEIAQRLLQDAGIALEVFRYLS